MRTQSRIGTRWLSQRWLGLILLLCCCHATVAAESAADPLPDLQRMADDTQRMRQQNNRLDLVWWIPSEYWEAAFRLNPGASPEQRAAFLEAVDEYLVLAVVEASFGPFGGLSATPAAELRDRVRVSVGGIERRPLKPEKVSDKANLYFDLMQPMIAGSLGQFGQGMEFIVFEGRDEDGERLVRPDRDGEFTVTLGDHAFHYRLPLGSFLPPVHDPETGERFPGNFRYNPFTGSPLERVAP